jgi:hypothetical protein
MPWLGLAADPNRSLYEQMPDCCQNCCHGYGRLPTRDDRPGTSPQQEASTVQFWTVCPCLRIRRLGAIPQPNRVRIRFLNISQTTAESHH